jgi:hypothetical protein
MRTNSNGNSTTITKMPGEMSPKDNGLALKIVILRVCSILLFFRSYSCSV